MTVLTLSKLPTGRRPRQCRHVPVRFFSLFPCLFLIIVEMVMVREEDVGGVEMHKMDIVGPHTNSIASSLWSAHAVHSPRY